MRKGRKFGNFVNLAPSNPLPPNKTTYRRFFISTIGEGVGPLTFLLQLYLYLYSTDTARAEKRQKCIRNSRDVGGGDPNWEIYPCGAVTLVHPDSELSLYYSFICVIHNVLYMRCSRRPYESNPYSSSYCSTVNMNSDNTFKS